MLKKISAILLLVFVVSGCHTMSGVGQDVQSAGAGLENSSDNIRPYN